MLQQPCLNLFLLPVPLHEVANQRQETWHRFVLVDEAVHISHAFGSNQFPGLARDSAHSRPRVAHRVCHPAFPFRFPCSHPWAYPGGGSKVQRLTTSGSSCGGADGSAASSRRDCWRRTLYHVPEQHQRAQYFRAPTLSLAVSHLRYPSLQTCARADGSDGDPCPS